MNAQVRRMIADPRGISLTRDFAFQWLNVAKMDTIVPSAALFQHASGVYDPRPAFKKELELFMDSILRADRPVTDLLTADTTFLNEQVALVYGYTNLRGNGFHPVKLDRSEAPWPVGQGRGVDADREPRIARRPSCAARGSWSASWARRPPFRRRTCRISTKR